MDDDSCSKFIGSLTKYLQSLCHSYVDFDSGVELVGHIYLNVDTGKKIDYVLNESVCKNGANVVKFTSNSYHAQPVEKQKKETIHKKTPPAEPTKTPEKEKEKKKNDDDDVMIVGTEPSRNRAARQGQSGSGSRHVVGANQLQRGQQRPMQAQGPGVFRHPRGPQPRMGMPRVGGYRYPMPSQAGLRGRPPGPRNYATVGYNPTAPGGVASRMDPMHVNNPYSSLQVRPPPAQARHPSDPVDMDVTFMREEYVPGSGQQPGRVPNQPGQPVTAPGQPVGTHLPPPPPLQPHATTATGQSAMDMMNQRYGYSQRPPAPQYMPGQPQQLPPHLQQQQPQFLGAPPVAPQSQVSHVISGQVPVSGVAQQSLGYGTQQNMAGTPPHQVPNSGAHGMEHVGVSQHQTVSTHGMTVSSAAPPSFLQSQPHVSSSGGMPLPVTTHTIFDSHPPMSSASASHLQQASDPLPAGGGLTPGGDAGSITVAPAPSSTPSSTAVPITSTVTSFPSSRPPTSMWGDTKPILHTGLGQTVSSVQTSPLHAHPQSSNPLSSPGPDGSNQAPHGSDSVGNIFDIFSHQQQQHSGPLSQSSQSPHQNVSSFPNSDGGSGNIGTHQLSSEAGDHSNVHPETPDFFSQFLEGNPATSGSDAAHPVSVYSAQNSVATTTGASSIQLPSMSPLPATMASTETNVHIKMDPGQIGVAIATSVIQEATEAAAHDAPETFLAPHGMSGSGQHQGTEAQRFRNGSTSSTPSLDAQSPGTHLDGIKIEAGSQQQTSDYESGWDSGSTAEKMSSPAHSSMRPLSVSLIPVDNSIAKSAGPARQSGTQGEDEWVRDMSVTSWKRQGQKGIGSDDESVMSDPEPDQDDDDPSYAPPRSRTYGSEKREGATPTKRPRGRPPGRGKKRKTDKGEAVVEDIHHEEQPHADMDVTAEVHQAPAFSPSIETDNAESGDSYYKPGTFLLVNTSKDSERSSRTRPSHAPAEVICTPEGQNEGLWVHLLIASGNGLWRLPNVEHLVDVCLDLADVVRTLSNASVKIVGSKVFYKFEDL